MGLVSRVQQVWVMNTRVFWIKHELMLDLAKSEWCWLALVAVFSSQDSIYRTTVSTAAFRNTSIYACVHSGIRIHAPHTWSGGKEGALWMTRVFRWWMATALCEWKQNSMYVCYTGVSRGHKHTDAHIKQPTNTQFYMHTETYSSTREQEWLHFSFCHH